MDVGEVTDLGPKYQGSTLIRRTCLYLILTVALIVGCSALAVLIYSILPSTPARLNLFTQRLGANEALVFRERYESRTFVMSGLLYLRCHWIVHQDYRPRSQIRLGQCSIRINVFRPGVTMKELAQLPEIAARESWYRDPFFATPAAAQLAQSKLAMLEVCVPLWIIAAVSLAYPMWWLIWGIARLRRRRLAKGLCPSCEYNLTGNTSGVCPECGTRIV